MNRLIGWLLVALAVVVGAVVFGPAICNLDWGRLIQAGPKCNLSEENCKRIGNGMTVEEVTRILGTPTKDATGTMAGVGAGHDSARFMIWSDGNFSVRVDFNLEGRVVAKTRHREGVKEGARRGQKVAATKSGKNGYRHIAYITYIWWLSPFFTPPF